MASFSRDFRYAYHVIPMHAAKPIAESGELRSKEYLAKSGLPQFRRSGTWERDNLLGFADCVHCYLLRGTERLSDDRWGNIPILGSKMFGTNGKFFPHAVIELDTRDIRNEETYAMCAYNVAYSRPALPGMNGGGNWGPGVRAETVGKFWENYRSYCETSRHMALGQWHLPCKVPLIMPNMYGYYFDDRRGRESPVARQIRGKTELEILFAGSIPLASNSAWKRIVVFTEEDQELLAMLGDSSQINANEPGAKLVEKVDLVKIKGLEDPTLGVTIRSQIREYFCNFSLVPPELDFD